MLKWASYYYNEKRGLAELKAYDSKEEALNSATYEWGHMSEHDRRQVNEFFVGLFNVDESGRDWEEKENGESDNDPREIAQRWT